MATQEQKNASALEEQAIALAEQLGRIAGTVEGAAESWFNRQALTDQLVRVRDGAAEMLGTLTDGAARGREAATSAVQTAASAARTASSVVLKRAGTIKKVAAKKGRATARKADAAHAPGKQHRKPGPSARGVKKSDLRIPKLRTATEVRQRRKF